MKPQNEMGKVVRGIRALLGMSQDYVAGKLGVTRSTLVKVEQGDRKWVRNDTVGDALRLFSDNGVDVYENDEYIVILVKK